MAAEPTFTDFDRRAMARALELAERGAETTHPNPRVGCVIARGEQIVAEGWHERAGGPHAEVAALRALATHAATSASSVSPGGTTAATIATASSPAVASSAIATGSFPAAAGSTAYVTLEPCSHHGRTPPCTEALIAARVARVVFAIEDPNPQVAGRGAAALRAAGIEVASGLMAAEAEELNAGFLMRMRARRPFVRVKMGASLDGRVALSNGKSQWITGEAARNDVQRWRARSSAVLTGIGTVLVDDPRLNVRLPGTQRQPLRVILDSELRTPLTAQVLDSSAPTLFFTQRGSADAEKALIAKGARIERPANSGAPMPPVVDLRAMLARLAELDINEVLVEAGPTLSGVFVRQGVADELLLYIAPKLLGPQARPLFDLPLLEDLQQAPRFRIIEQQLIGEDLRLRLRAA
jgi:diaminohydroxyphosphoribosylaminopyrimidine deaminase/5-amino-6-(5-phosphoribosylamino)uracil reductase